MSTFLVTVIAVAAGYTIGKLFHSAVEAGLTKLWEAIIAGVKTEEGILVSDVAKELTLVKAYISRLENNASKKIGSEVTKVESAIIDEIMKAKASIAALETKIAGKVGKAEADIVAEIEKLKATVGGLEAKVIALIKKK